MSVKLHAEGNEAFPRLGWFACIDLRSKTVSAVCGKDIEVGDDFIVEGVWDGPFQDGGFHHANHFFGSGLRIEREAVYVVPSHGLVDRVVIAKRGSLSFASNSFALLLAGIGDGLDPERDYRDSCRAIIAGVRSYDPRIPTEHGEVQQGFRSPHLIDQNGIRRENMSPPINLKHFDEYYDALQRALRALMDNAASTWRKVPIGSYCTTSTGYDSAAVSALAKDYGVKQSFTTFGGVTLDGAPLEDGRLVTSALGLEALELQPRIPDRWHEQLVLAATYDGRESLYASMFEHFATQKHVACLWSGYHGDKLWDRTTSGEYLESDIRRGDMSGFNLSEVRLDTGFINFSIPFMFAPSIRDIVKIANLPEMAAWQVGGGYDRPIPRRIAEQHGVSREQFGQQKSVIMEYYTYCRNAELANEFNDYLTRDQNFGPVARLLYRLAEQLDYWRGRKPEIFGRLGSLREMMRPGAKDLANTLYVWAINNIKEIYSQNCPKQMQKPGDAELGSETSTIMPHRSSGE